MTSFTLKSVVSYDNMSYIYYTFDCSELKMKIFALVLCLLTLSLALPVSINLLFLIPDI